jgi:hypothetical protein
MKINECPICRGKVDCVKEIISMGTTCSNCHTNVPNILFYPCSHVVICNICDSKKSIVKCSECNDKFAKAIAFYK